jgi:Family of unknown function (DUF6424)
MTTSQPEHTETETHTWSVNIPDHAQRTDSPEYVAAKNKMNEIAAQANGLLYGPGPFQDHHGSALWLQDSQGWFMVRNLAGIEWSAQFCADPVQVDKLRVNAQRLYNLVAPQLKQELDPNGVLDAPITDADGVSTWTDSIFNAGVPLHPSFHTGVLQMGKAQNPPATATTDPNGDGDAPTTAAPGDPEPAGVHYYPTPVVDIQLFKYADFQLWVTDPEGNPTAVTPVAARGSGNASVHVMYATPGSQLAQQKQQQESAGNALVLPADHMIAKQAFQHQNPPQ